MKTNNVEQFIIAVLMYNYYTLYNFYKCYCNYIYNVVIENVFDRMNGRNGIRMHVLQSIHFLNSMQFFQRLDMIDLINSIQNDES